MEIPVYLFTGFLESGKTKFIQETLEDKRFNTGEKTLLLICEEGIEEYDPSRFYGKNVYLEKLTEMEDLRPEKLEGLCKAHNCERVVIEFNGMWMLDDLYNNMPESWNVYQEIAFADSETFLNYNANMRTLVYDKLKSCELIVFNRFKYESLKLEFHRIVRAVGRRADIIYEDPAGNVKYDDIVDPLPFDLDAPVIEIKDGDYAVWYRDVTEEMKKYDGKTVRVQGIADKTVKMPPDSFVFGRRMMTCCIQDIRFAGFACIWNAEKMGELDDQQWITLTAKIKLEKHRAYGKKGPVFHVVSAERAAVPEQEVATFY
ncbi:MAG: GTPase [Oscillospiraceae bacterium]